jgi:hypothetical protein
LTWSLCSIMILLTHVRSKVFHAKTCMPTTSMVTNFVLVFFRLPKDTDKDMEPTSSILFPPKP